MHNLEVSVGDTITAPSTGPVILRGVLGSGGEGVVFLAETTAGEQYALKWLFSSGATPDRWAAFEYLLDRGRPDPRFLWPTDLVRSASGQQFGYLMPLRPHGYIKLAHLASGKDETGDDIDVSYLTAIDMCRQLAEAFLRLHSLGMSYRDISLHNVFFRPSDGSIQICDVDNVAVDNGSSTVRGTGRFMAPEIVADRSGATLPSTATDRHSLAVLMFVILFAEHPLEGGKTHNGMLGNDHLWEHFGRDPLFSLDPNDDRNRPVPAHVARYWNEVYPVDLRNLFLDAFTAGLRNPGVRVPESLWLRVLARVRGYLGECPACSADVFFDPVRPDAHCWSCGSPLGTPLVFEHASRRVVLRPGLSMPADLSARVPLVGEIGNGAHPAVVDGEYARTVRHPTNPKQTGLKNLSTEAWRVEYDDGVTGDVEPGRVCALTEGAVVTGPGGRAFRVVRDAPIGTS